MRDLDGRTAIVTGASRGLGLHIARTLAAERMNLVLAARSAPEIEALAAELSETGIRAVAVPTDVADRAALEHLVDVATRELGGIDVLVNNAGIENVMSYHKLSFDEIEQAVRVNLMSAMILTRLALPGMLERRRGHIVNMASLAGKSGPAYGEPYAATKAGLIGFTQALRATYRGSGVSASVICPGFVEEAGMYYQNKVETGVAASRLIGTSPVKAVTAAVVKAIKKDMPEVIVNPGPIRLLLAVSQLSPSLAEWTVRRMGVREQFGRVAEIRERQRAEAERSAESKQA